MKNMSIDLGQYELHRKNPLTGELLWYFAVSLVALFVDLGLFSLALRLGELPWALAATLGFAAGVITAWWLSVRFVFQSRALRQKPIVEFAGFLGIGIAGLGVTEIVLWLGIELLSMLPEFSKLVAAGVTFVFNFALRKWLLFRKQTLAFLPQQDSI